MSLIDRIRSVFKRPEPDHPLSEEERDEQQPETTFDAAADLERDFAGRDIDPEEPRSGRD